MDKFGSSQLDQKEGKEHKNQETVFGFEARVRRVDCFCRDSDNLGEAVPSQFSELNPDDQICGCETYIWNSATLVPNECYGPADVDF